MEKRRPRPSLPILSDSHKSIMGRKGLLLLLFILVMNCPTKSDKSLDTLLDFCVVKGLKYISVINFSTKLNLKVIYEKLRVRELKTFPDIFGYMYEDTFVILIDELTDFDSIIGFVTKTRRKSSILLNIGQKTMQISRITSVLEKARRNSYFYVIDHKKVWQVITVAPSPKVILQLLKKSHKYYETYDLQGLIIENIALDFPPFLLIDDCQNGKNCKTSGLLAQLQDVSCALLNCTWTTVKPQDNYGWGVTQISGPFSRNGTFGGVFGGIINEEFMTSISSWFWIADRFDLLEFYETGFNQMILVIEPKMPEIDMGLFIRPFTEDAWKGILATFVSLTFVFLLPFILVKRYSSTDSYIIVGITGGIFYQLLNSYYGGALTMFFTSEISIPFTNKEDVMEEYPTWKLKTRAGEEVFFQARAFAGDPLYVEFLDRINNEPEEAVFDTIADGLNMLRSEQSVLYLADAALKGHFQVKFVKSQLSFSNVSI